MTTCDVAAVGWVIALIGFIVNNRFSNQRETRKEIRAKLDHLNKSLDSLLEASRNYYLDDAAILSKESIRIHEAINSCDRIIQELSRFNKDCKLQPDFYIIYDVVTGGKFESAKHQPGEHNGPICKRLSIQKEALMQSAEDWFSAAFNQRAFT
ncbi:hypothetical protein A1359_09195 [Methylomonas lenta]|uniref:Uncharacterized protein n=1 Tax=Methylomonas lenta TaxID=980561 RepID=A0A177NCL5_9GAMM|nr:hypothetical protein [Methylomonas lenta]OAI15581.1 hypothetical protein A1359_09195 [Methylomonas lenta]